MRIYSFGRVAAVVVAGLLGGTASAQVIDGQLDAGFYGSPVAIQNNSTQFGNSTAGQVSSANGSELNNAYGRISGGSLFLFIGGNLETNFNKLELFFHTGAAGQNVLRNDNPNVDFNGLNRMAGLTFDSPFSATRWMSLTGGDIGGGNFAIFGNFSELLPTGGGTGGYLGQTTYGTGSGTLTGGSNPFGIRGTINNSNTAGVSGGVGLDSGAGVTTGIEVEIPLAALGNPSGDIWVSAFINGGGHDFVSNQVLGGLGGLANLGEPANVNFANIAGDQYFIVAVPEPTSLVLAGLAPLGWAARRLRRKA
ncbi:MAG: PEP-CTERM sorting domain-containing protein [Gemmataceae bacterium]|nr:PEP-CTERM sorting domain-containing protein [Gemmataceae bacterium]